MYLLPILASLACTPVLTSDDTGGTAVGSDWVAPDNQWPSGDPPPADLTEEGFDDGQVTPDMRLLDQNGDTVSMWQFYGMVVVIDISTGWCAPCAELAQTVDHTMDTYRSQGFMYLTLMPQNNVGEVPNQEDLQKWADDNSVSAPILSDDQEYSLEIMGSSQVFPRILVIGRDMIMLNNDVQPVDEPTIEAAIEAAL